MKNEEIEFEWDPDKANSNLEKHGVSFHEAKTVFADPLSQYFQDLEHSDSEDRSLLIGYSAKEKLLIVIFTIRENRVRIISARRATPSERYDHEENSRLY